MPVLSLGEDLARQENRLWEIARGSNGEPHLDELPGGKAAIETIDAYFLAHPEGDRASLLSSLPPDQRAQVQTFLDTNPRAAQYVDQYGRIHQSREALSQVLQAPGTQNTAGMTADQAGAVCDKIIADVDTRYEDGGPQGQGFDATQIAADSIIYGPGQGSQAGASALTELYRTHDIGAIRTMLRAHGMTGGETSGGPTGPTAGAGAKPLAPAVNTPS